MRTYNVAECSKKVLSQPGETTLRQSDFAVRKARNQENRHKHMLNGSSLLGAPEMLLLYSQNGAKKSKRDVKRIRLRSLHVSASSLYINYFSEEERLRQLRFHKQQFNQKI